LVHTYLQSQTFDGNLGSKSLSWTTEQKDFNSLPRVGIAPMSIKLWDNYEGANAPSSWGSLLELNGKESHLVSQLYFDNTWNGSRISYRTAFYGQNTWESWRYILDSKSDVQSVGNLKITGNANNYILNGYVGIGTTTPNSKLTIRSGGTGVSIHPGTNPYFGTLAFNRESGTGEIFDVNGQAFQINNGGTDKHLHFQVYNGNGSQITNEALVISGINGNIGIGTSNPTSKLTVAGDINSREVKVTVNAGADFVFAEDYDLPSLDSVDKYITANKHLPEIASAKEMQKDGINLSEMNIKLLQKVEELTLYVIEQNKRIEKLEISNK
jgi:hypothetical protein